MVESAALNSLFADSLLQTSWSQRTRRSWTTLTSFGLQVLALGLLLLLPVLRTVGLPSARTVSRLSRSGGARQCRSQGRRDPWRHPSHEAIPLRPSSWRRGTYPELYPPPTIRLLRREKAPAARWSPASVLAQRTAQRCR